MGGCCASSNPKAKHDGKRSSRSHDGAQMPRQPRGGPKESVLLPDLGQSDQSGSKQAASGGRPRERQEPGPFRTAEQPENSLLVDQASDQHNPRNKAKARGATSTGFRNNHKFDNDSSIIEDQQSKLASANRDAQSDRNNNKQHKIEQSQNEAEIKRNEPKPIQTVDLSPKVKRQSKIYSITGRPPVQSPCSRDSEWQQVLQLFSQRLNLASFQNNFGSLNPSSIKNKKQGDIQNQLEQIQTHREIELMVSLLTLRNRNWLQEQIKMSRRLANMRPVSFESIVVTREYLQLKEHFNWLVWAVGYYYFQMSKIEQFFQFHQTKQMQNKTDGISHSAGASSQRQKQQNMLYHEINHLLGQVTTLKAKLPSPISRKWTEGFTFQGVHFRMLPLSDGFFVRNELKALKYIQNELMELNQLQNQLEEFQLGQSSNVQSIYKQLIMPMLSAVECGGFFIFASPLIYIQGYTEESVNDDEYSGSQLNPNDPSILDESDLVKAARAQSHIDEATNQLQLLFPKQQQQTRRRTVLSNIYGSGVYRTREIINQKINQSKPNKSDEIFRQSFAFLQENLGSIDDPLLSTMPLLRQITNENVIPIIDFEDQNQVDLNFLLIHVIDCLPSAQLNNSSNSSISALAVPSDLSNEVTFLEIPDIEKVPLAQITDLLRLTTNNASSINALSYERPNQSQRFHQSNIANPTNSNAQILKYSGQDQKTSNDLADEDDHIVFGFDGNTQNSKVSNQKNRAVEVRLFTKHGFDLLMITNKTKGVLSEIETTSEGVSLPNRLMPGNQAARHQVKDSILVNKRAQALYAAKEDESLFDGQFKTQQNQVIKKIIDSQSLSHNNQAMSHPRIGHIQKGQTGVNYGLGQGTKPVERPNNGLLTQGPKKASILRRVAGQSSLFGMGSGVVSGHGLYSENSEFSQAAGGQAESAIRGNAVLIVDNSTTQMRLKYPLISMAYSCSLEQIYIQTINSVAKILEDSDSIFSIQALKDLLHRKGLNLRFEWLLLAKVKGSFNRELIMIHILVRTMKRIINEEVKIKAQVFTPNKPKPASSAAPKSLSDHQKNSAKRDQQIQQQNIRQYDHFIGANQENFKDNLVFFSNTLLRRKFSKQKHVFDETLIGLFLSRLKVMPILNSLCKFGNRMGLNLFRDSEISFIESKQILEEVISAPSQNPALFMSSIQTYFNIEIEQEFLRKCRQDKYLFLSKLTSQPMVMNNVSSVNLKCHVFFSLKEHAYFMLANQMHSTQVNEAKENNRVSQLHDQYRANANEYEDINGNAANLHLRNKIFQQKSMNKPDSIYNRAVDLQNDGLSTRSEQGQHNKIERANAIGPIGGVPGRREAFITGSGVMHLKVAPTGSTTSYQNYQIDQLNSSSITDNNKHRFQIQGQASQPTIQMDPNGVPNESIISRSSALQSQTQTLTQKQGNNKMPSAKQLTPRQFKNIDSIDKRDSKSYKAQAGQPLQRQMPQINGFNFDGELQGNSRETNPEIVIPAILYKLNVTCMTDMMAVAPGLKGKDFRSATVNSSQLYKQCASSFSAYYKMPTQHIFDTWIMYLEGILKEVYSVEGSEQILLEALNYLALTIYFGEQAHPSLNQYSKFQNEVSSPLQSPGSDRSFRGLGLSRQGQSAVGADQIGQKIFDRDQFLKVAGRIKDIIETTTSKCSPEVIVVSQIIRGLSYEHNTEEIFFPIDSEKSYLTALICLFQTIGDPRGRGNYSVPYMLLVTWKLGLLSLSIENRKVHDAEFAEELFDATLCNLLNHKMLFRQHQNDKLSRVIVQQDQAERKNQFSDSNKDAATTHSRKPATNFNSRRSHYQGDIRDQFYHISAFEQEMDLQQKFKTQFNIKAFQNKRDTFGLEMANMSVQESQNTPRNKLKGPNSSFFNFQNSQGVYDDGIHSMSHKKPRDAQNINQEGIANISVSQSYQGIGFGGMIRSTAGQQNAKNIDGQSIQSAYQAGMQRSQPPQNDRRLNDHLSNIIGNNQLKQRKLIRHTNLKGNSENKDRFNPHPNDPINSFFEANISDIDLELDEDTEKELNAKLPDIEQSFELPDSEFAILNFPEDAACIPEVPFIHWSIYRQGIQNVVSQQGHKFQRNQKQINKFLCQMFKNVLFTAIDKNILRPWLLKYNPIMYQSGLQWKNSQIKQAVHYQTAQMISSRSSSKSFAKNESEYSLSLSIQGSMISQGVAQSFRSTAKTQHLGSYSSIINSENGSINKGDVHGVLYSWGSDAHGQLGHDSFAHLTQKPVSQKVLYPRMLSVLKDEFIKEVCCGYAHTLAITIHGAVYSWGNNESGQLGLGSKAPDFVRKAKLIPNLKSIVKLSAGNEHSVALNKNQEIFSWGSCFQTGQNDSQNRCTPQKINFFRNMKVQQVACGGLHTLALTKDHKVFCWGSTEGGQLGLPTNQILLLCNNEENAVKSPQLLVSLIDLEVTQLACGETHSLCLCKDGRIYGWGTSMYGQLGMGFSADSFEPGIGMQRSKVPEPRLIEALQEESISKIFCGSTFSLFLTNNGELYGCGMNDVGQLGEDVFNDLSALESAKIGQMQTSDVTLPTQVSSLQGIKIHTVACGEAHVLAIDGDGIDSRNMLWAWGQFKNGQLGLGELSMKLNPRPVQNLASSTIHKIACGSAHSLALVGDASNVTTLSPNFYAGNEMLANTWATKGLANKTQ